MQTLQPLQLSLIFRGVPCGVSSGQGRLAITTEGPSWLVAFFSVCIVVFRS